jgi:hypothetical protein
VLKSIDNIPSFLNNTAVVITITGDIINNSPVHVNKYSTYGLNKEKFTEWSISNKKLIINTDNKDLELVILKAIFTDPEELQKITTCESLGSNTICKKLDSDFSIDDDLVEELYRKVLFIIANNYNTKQDIKLNTLDDSHA